MAEPKHRAEEQVGRAGLAAVRARAALTNDARNRTIRTFLQGLAFVVISNAVLVLLPVFTGATDWSDFDLDRTAFSLVQAVGTAVLAWLWRKYLDRSKVPSLEPPSDPGEPNEAGAAVRDTVVVLALLVVLAFLLLAFLPLVR